VQFNRLFSLLASVLIARTFGFAADQVPRFELVRQGGAESINSVGDQLGRFTKWAHGAYVVMDWMGGQGPLFYTHDRDGLRTQTAKIQNPDSGYIYVFGYDRESNGSIVFTGQIETAYRVESPFLGWTSSDGQNQKLLRTGNYFPYEVAVAPDDSIWTLGYEMVNLNPEDPAVNRDANVLRHFDRNGNLISSALPQSQFDSYQLHRITTGLLIASQDRVGWYGPRGKNAIYTEVALGSMVKADFPGAGPAGSAGLPVSVAFGNGNLPVVSVQENSARARTIYALDRSRATWMPLDVPPMGGFKFTPNLAGGDGTQLVFKYGREAGFFSVHQ